MPRVCSKESRGTHYQVVSVAIVALYLQFHDALAVELVGTRELSQAPSICRSPDTSLRNREY